MAELIKGFEWDAGNRSKCTTHGVSIEEIEAAFQAGIMVFPDEDHSQTEPRFRGVGTTAKGRRVLVVFTIRHERVRALSARYMHRKEIQHYEKQNEEASDVQD
jgi:hypothetical protein